MTPKQTSDGKVTLTTKPLRSADVKEFVKCVADGPDSDRRETWTKRKRAYAYADLERRSECNLDLDWLTREQDAIPKRHAAQTRL